MFERPRTGERAVLVRLGLGAPADPEDIEEFTQLAVSAGAQPVATITGRRERPDPRYFVGSGKAEEIRDCALANTADVILVDHALSPSQERNLEKLAGRRVLDRNGLILDIFAQRARSHEGKLQVELAQLKHIATRLVRGWTHLERQRGGGIGLRGPGETQLETDRRLVGQRVRVLTRRLEKLQLQRETGRRARAEIVHRGVRNPRESWLLANCEVEEEMIGPLNAPVVPQFLKATCSKVALRQLQTILDEVHAWASGLVGLECTEADVLYNGDPVAIFLRDEFIAWAVAHTHERLARRNPRDQDEPFRRFYRLFMEICGWLDKVCLIAGPRVALSEVPPRIAAEIWDATVGREIRVYPGEGEDLIDYGRLNPAWHHPIRQMVLLHAWNQSEALSLARKQFTSRAPGEPATLVARRRAMAADIVETRALLIAGYDGEAIACPQPGGWTTFEWDLMHSTGIILLARTREKLLDSELAGELLYPLRADLDGRIAGNARWWEPGDDIAWEVALLELAEDPDQGLDVVDRGDLGQRDDEVGRQRAAGGADQLGQEHVERADRAGRQLARERLDADAEPAAT